MSRRESVGRSRTASQSESAEPSVKMVSCAVLPPRLPPGMAPPTGIGAADAFNWDEAINWQHNDAVNEQEPSRRKSFLRKVGLTTQRKRTNEDMPPFIMRQIPYDRWRKHYAKDAEGNYRGTHAPAQDCLLKPEDVQKWRLGDAVTRADQWTRGSVALPVYSEAHAEGAAPDYEVDHPEGSQSAATKQILTPEEGRLAEYFDATEKSAQPQRTQSATSPPHQGDAVPQYSDEIAPPHREEIADGKTADEIIAEAKAKGKPKLTWKEKVTKGINQTMAAGSY